ncbi:CRAL-TRIO domain-containing protein [Aspergillus aurantiobrunneus]
MALDAKAASTFSTFRRKCAEEGLLKRRPEFQDDDIVDGFTDDATLLRFLQANRMQPSKALDQYQQATKFHTENDALRYCDQISVPDYESARHLYPHWTGRRDRQGRPILFLDVAAMNPEGVARWRKTRDMPLGTISGDICTTPNMAQRALVYFDTITRFVLPLCSAVHSQPVTNCVYVVDVSSLAMRQVWDVRELARDVSWILGTCYPETIYRIYACNVPGFLARLWSLLKGFVDPMTASKIQFLQSSESYESLIQDIDHANIPSAIGGGLQVKKGMLPDLDDETRQALSWTVPEGDLPAGPLKWIESESGELKAVATGTEDGEARRIELATLRT